MGVHPCLAFLGSTRDVRSQRIQKNTKSLFQLSNSSLCDANGRDYKVGWFAPDPPQLMRASPPVAERANGGRLLPFAAPPGATCSSCGHVLASQSCAKRPILRHLPAPPG